MFAYLENEADLLQMGMGGGGMSGTWGGEWSLGVLLYITKRVTVSLGHWRGEREVSSSLQTSGSR